ncbi:MAG TPA: hypothetical protein VMR88_06685 [Candidatus Polarisedimenticolaceae bacterium]|nr:hypothetical protein [Candidatus Polarisedimenticolaceae bacterium]
MRRPLAVIFNLVICLSISALPSPASPLPLVSETPLPELIPLVSWQRQFKITEGKDRGKVVPLTSEPDLTNGKRWKLVFGDYAAVHLVREPGGALTMKRLDFPKSRSFIIYDSALPVMPSDVKSSDLIHRETGYKMYSLATGKLKRAGRVTHQVKPASSLQFDTPAGRLDGYYVEIDHRMDMEYYSQLHLTLGLGCQLDRGPVYGSGQYTLTKLGVFTDSKTAGAALVAQ